MPDQTAESRIKEHLMIRSPLSGWMGGKYQLARKIVEQIPDHACYCEPFAGAAWPLFAKEPSRSEVINDINKDVINLYRVLQHHVEEFLKFFKWVLVSRDEFDRLLKQNPETLTDIQRAARFYYIQKTCFGGRLTSPSFGYSKTVPSRLNLVRIEEELSAVHLRLARVLFENLSYPDILNRYDGKETFFYIDPPYWDTEDVYGKNLFSKDDFSKLAGILKEAKGKFLLSLNDVPEIRQIFSEFFIKDVSLKYSCGRNPKAANELFIRNY